MYSKRQLYQPAPKQNVGQKKTRRKLVQGVSTNTTDLMNLAGSVDDSNSNSNKITTPNASSIRSIISYDVQDDPSMTPCRSVPALTEHTSPQAEPPSRYLDLSDTDLNPSTASNNSTSSQQRVMVCDASHLVSSPDRNEVDVIVKYEDSPARVICHSPRQPETSLHQSSPRVTAGKRGPTSLLFRSPKATSSAKNTRDLNQREKKDIHIISEYSRGIIKEILADEIVSKSISLYSNESSPTNLPRSSSPVEISEHAAANSNYSHTAEYNIASKTPPKTKAVLSKLNFEESDVSHSESSDRNGRVDRTPKIESAKAQLLKHSQSESDSETCSLYEYVKQIKDDSGTREKSQVNQEKKSLKTQEVAKKPRSAKKKPGRVVASRYMQSSTAAKVSQASLSSAKDSTAENSSFRTNANTNTTKPKIMSNKPLLKPSSSSNRLPYVIKNKSCPATTAPKASEKKQYDRLTSTHIHDSCSPFEFDASSIHDSRADNTPQGKVDNKRSKISPLQLDMQYKRYLQALYLSTWAKRSFKEQEKQAMEQLNGLWLLTEKKRAELAQSKLELDRLKALLQMDIALDVTEPQLASLEEKTQQVAADYANLCSALNNTRHQILTKDIYVPNATEEEREAYEDKLESTLKDSGRLLDKIALKTAGNIVPVHQYKASVHAIGHNLEVMRNELPEGHKDLEEAHGLCSQLSSRLVMPK